MYDKTVRPASTLISFKVIISVFTVGLTVAESDPAKRENKGVYGVVMHYVFIKEKMLL